MAQTSAPADGEVSATVVALDDGDLVVDIGSSKGAAVGDVVELWRPLRLRHPVTREWLSDRFQIGTLRLAQVGATLSLAKPERQPARAPQPGDLIVLRAAAMVPTMPAADGSPKPRPVSPGPARSPDTVNSAGEAVQDTESEALTAIFDALRGADPVRRIRAYEDYVRANPRGRFAVVLYEEAQALRGLVEGYRRGDESRPLMPELVRFHEPRGAMAASPLSVGVETTDAALGAVLHARGAGDVAFWSIPMSPAGPGYWTATVPAERMNAPKLEYFVEAIGTRGQAQPLVGSANSPVTSRVEQVPKPSAPPRREATASLLTDYADYNRWRGNDYAWQTEGCFGLRYGDVGMRAVRSGFGVYRGAGGTIKDLDEVGRLPRRIGLTYGYLEAEWGVSRFVSLIGRGAVGLRDEGTSGGGQAMIRIGNDRSTNLLFGGEFLGGVGLRGITQLELNTFARVPILLRSEVTNQPAGVSDSTPRPTHEDTQIDKTSSEQGDIGARAIVQVGYRITPAFTVSARGSYQGRTIKHAGPGFGAGFSYQW
ncbi:MAG: hypothetical protein MUF54_07035 [Polyangiaceae bacterium]|jgi:hypothetical protein|nr:hypothetical protein [Polyangiaceae bacterium]